MKYFKKYIGNVLFYLLLIFWLWVLSFWVRIVFSSIEDKDYGLLSFFLILSGIVVIIFGYLATIELYNLNRASPYAVEMSELLIKKRELNEKLTMNEKVTLWIEDGYGIKFCNRLGLILVLIGIIVYIFITIADLIRG
ncbi:hypothetical protein PJV97_06520 [Aliarcobacter butzleri]|uniref:hypothetical protein n=1 Tax=Aliarcobacter butzleri TaxID=28197 RepID=UPI001EDA0BB6|nr:hypothetical protein [Aliarcobacter butzleri]MCG3653500.1 hypothetical protein [Aliarcobacter butzleri]MDN5112004.1 hypothetical protein [Aliarcobacter butzleri]